MGTDLLWLFGGGGRRPATARQLGRKVITRGFPIFGGFENVTAKERVGPGAPVLEVHATILFGGVEIKH